MALLCSGHQSGRGHCPPLIHQKKRKDVNISCINNVCIWFTACDTCGWDAGRCLGDAVLGRFPSVHFWTDRQEAFRRRGEGTAITTRMKSHCACQAELKRVIREQSSVQVTWPSVRWIVLVSELSSVFPCLSPAPLLFLPVFPFMFLW